MNRRSLITGAGGFLGSRTCEHFSGRDGHGAVGVTYRELDIEDFVVVSVFVKAIRPDYILYCTAILSIGACEGNPVPSKKVNVRGTVNLARAYRKTGSRMMPTSSDRVYNTSHSLEPNREGSEEKSGNVYGKDKKRAEEIMLTYLPDVVAPRLIWLYDAPFGGEIAGQDFLQRLTDTSKERRKVEFPVHDYRGITYMWEVARRLEEAMGSPGGTYNFGSEGRYNTLDTVRLFLRELTGGDFGSVLECDDECFISRSRNLIMNTGKIRPHEIRFFNVSEGIRKCCLEHREISQAWC